MHDEARILTENRYRAVYGGDDSDRKVVGGGVGGSKVELMVIRTR